MPGHGLVMHRLVGAGRCIGAKKSDLRADRDREQKCLLDSPGLIVLPMSCNNMGETTAPQIPSYVTKYRYEVG